MATTPPRPTAAQFRVLEMAANDGLHVSWAIGSHYGRVRTSDGRTVSQTTYRLLRDRGWITDGQDYGTSRRLALTGTGRAVLAAG